MRGYAKVAPQFWIGATGKKIRKQGAAAQIVAMYLLSSPHSNMIGLYHLPIAYMSADTGLPFEGASKGLADVCEAGFATYDQDAEVVWVHEMARFQIDSELKYGDKRCAGVQNTYDDVPECLLLSAFYERYAGAFNLKNKRQIASPLQAPCKPLRSQEQEQEQEQEQGSGAALPSAPKNPQAELSKTETELQATCRETWKSYGDAYFSRYKTEPVRNATVNAQVKQFVKRIGFSESPFVAAFFLQNNSAFYVQRGHAFGNLLADAEKIRTEWATGSSMTATRARQLDQHQANGSMVDEAMRIIESQGAQS